MMFKPKSTITIIVSIGLILILVTALQQRSSLLKNNYHGISDFGMNKAHLLFHLGERSKIAVNYGFGFWHTTFKSRPSTGSNFTKMRLFYENTKNGLYVNMLSHDGGTHIHEKIQDRTHGLDTNIRYQMLDDGWEQHIHMNRIKDREVNTTSSYWFTYMTVQNTDPALIKMFDTPSKTPVILELKDHLVNKATVKLDRASGVDEEIKVSSSEPFKVFGFSMNISQTYDVRNSMDEIKYLIELQRFKMKKRKNDSDLVKWENQQLQIMKDDNWIGQKFLVLVFYGEFTGQCEVVVSNRTQAFDAHLFQQVSQRLDRSYFPVEQFSEHSAFLRHMIYNLYGGTAFYYGVLYTQNSLLRHELDYSYSFTPSRLIFPRGFLWDDGFHLSVAVNYNPSLTLHVLNNWIKKIDLLGWIGREQIRGFEMSSLMPEAKFIYQDIFEMNPPTLILPILLLIEKTQANELHESTVGALNSLLQQNFWKIQKWYRYFIKTQSHYNLMEKESINKAIKYRWRCKDDCQRGNFMGSGLDDYPRLQKQSQISKQHVDLMSWIYFFSEGMEKIASYLNQTKPADYYRIKKQEMKTKIYQECLDQKDFIFKDQTVKAKNIFIDQLVTKVGYISLFPFFTGVLRLSNFQLQDQERVELVRKKLVSIMMDPDLLLSEDGLRSLSKSDPLFGTLDNYWRGAVWLPINYLVLRACKRYYWQHEEIRELYATVRQRLIQTTKRNWEETGYLFENYHEGKGNRGHPFYGWTTLIVNIITEQY